MQSHPFSQKPDSEPQLNSYKIFQSLKQTHTQTNKQTNKALSRKQTLILHLSHKVSAILRNCGNTVYFPYDFTYD